jgi:hypothetical protein
MPCLRSQGEGGGVILIYLSGAIRPKLLGLRPDLGVIVTPMMGNKVDLSAGPWGGDTGCFAKPEAFSLSGYLDWLAARAQFLATCLFATAPDVVGDAKATWAKSAPVLPQIRAAGAPAALVAQDGIEEVAWDEFDALFLGGSTGWKLSSAARELVDTAKERGKWVHMGRVNSLSRLETAQMWGCDSADGTFLCFGPDKNAPRLLRWLDSLKARPVLSLRGAA